MDYGFSYVLIYFSAYFSPAWVIAVNWQFTVVFTLFVLMFFGKKFPKKIWFFSIIIFIGVCLVNLFHIDTFDLKALLLGGMIFLGNTSLNLISIIGLGLIMIGLSLFTKYQNV